MAILVQVVLIEDMIDVGLNSLVVAGGWSAIWQLCDGSCRFLGRSVVFLTAFEINFKKRVIGTGTAIFQLCLYVLFAVRLMKVCLGRLCL